MTIRSRGKVYERSQTVAVVLDRLPHASQRSLLPQIADGRGQQRPGGVAFGSPPALLKVLTLRFKLYQRPAERLDPARTGDHEQDACRLTVAGEPESLTR